MSSTQDPAHFCCSRCCIFVALTWSAGLQEVQLYTADLDQHLHTGRPCIFPVGASLAAEADCKTQIDYNPQVKNEADSQEQGCAQQPCCQGRTQQPCCQAKTHCSANSLQAQGHLQGIAGQHNNPDATGSGKQSGKMREASADSEEVKGGCSSEVSGGEHSTPHSRSPASLGPCRMSTTQRQQSGDLQTGSGGQSEPYSGCNLQYARSAIAGL